jgi:glutamine cyclotransferase
MKNTSIITLSLVIFASCNTEKKQESTTKTEVKTTQTETCYKHTKDSSTIKLNIKINDNMVTGNLLYDYYQKDRSAGKIEGELKSDTLFADYTFVSEGVESVREVVFIKTADGWVEGYGEIDDKDGKVMFKDKSKITFDNNVVLRETTCQ